MSASFRAVEKALERNMAENVNIPIFDIDDIGQKLEAELNNNLIIQNDKELEELIINETIRNLDI
jgi:hypothetical protein